MLRRNPLAALSLQQPSLRTPSLKLADDMPFELDKEEDGDSPDGACVHPNSALCTHTPALRLLGALGTILLFPQAVVSSVI